MTGRGVDQLLPHPSRPDIYEEVFSSAIEYVALAEQQHGPLPRAVAPDYVWGDALEQLRVERPHVRIVNLETSVTTSERAEPKGINYRMHPSNVSVLTAAGIDCCVLANNHVLDWGVAGLVETLDTLGNSKIHSAGAGRRLVDAEAPAILDVGVDARVLVFGLGSIDSGIPRSWSAEATAPGVCLLRDFSSASAADVARVVERTKRPGDVAVASIHWGVNWGYDVPMSHQRFARMLIERASIDVVHGHSSHHPRAIEICDGHPVVYGCGDFLNDYEGISGYTQFRGDLALMYFVTIDSQSGKFRRLEMVPLQVHRFRLRTALDADRAWLRDTLDRECARFGHRVDARDGKLVLVP